MYQIYQQYRLILFILLLLVCSSACGNLLNEEVIISTPEISEPEQIERINTFFNKVYSTDAAINIQTKYDEYLISGSAIDESNIDNIWFASIDSSGNLLFESTLKLLKHGRVVAQITDQDKNYIFICNEFDPVTFESDILLLKISPDKQIQWQYQLENNTSTFALSAALLTSGKIAITGQAENAVTSIYEPVLIKIDPNNNLVSSMKLDFQISSQNSNIYPIPVKIISDKNDTLTIAGYYITPQSKSRIAVVKIDSLQNIISKYILYETTKHLDILDILYQNPTYDILLICKSDTPRGREDGFTLLKIFKDSSIEYEQDYILDGFTVSDNIIAGNEDTFSVGGFIKNTTADYSIALVRFNFSGNIINYHTTESGIPSINRIVFSSTEKSNFISYIYSSEKINTHRDRGLFARRVSLTAVNKNLSGITYYSNSIKSDEGCLRAKLKPLMCS